MGVDAAWLYAGGNAQLQFTLLTAAFHHLMPVADRPAAQHAPNFVALNVALFVVPFLFALYLGKDGVPLVRRP